MRETKLYHYTTVEAAQSIVEKNKFWATHINYLNDPLEFSIGFDITSKIVLEIIRELYNSDNDRDKVIAVHIFEAIKNILKYFLKNNEKLKEDCLDKVEAMEKDEQFKILKLKLVCETSKLSEANCQWDSDEDIKNFNIFLISFSQREDTLRQWIPYGNNAKGIVLKFNDSIKDCKEYLFAQKVIYIENNEETINKFKVEFKTELKEYFNKKCSGEDFLKYNLAEYFLKLIICKALTIKSSNYADEAEVRICIMKDNKETKFRTIKNVLTPYVTFEFKKNALEEIKLGPCCNDELNKFSFELLVKKLQYDTVKITKSQIAYR